MTDSIVQDWKKELRTLLHLIEQYPSRDLAQERDRVVVLQKLIAERSQHVAA